MKKLKKPKKLRYQDGGIARDNTQVSPVPIGSLKAWEKYPRTPSPREAGNTFLNEVVNPFLSFGFQSGTPGGGVRFGPQVLEDQAAVDYLNSQRAWRPGNKIGTKADLQLSTIPESNKMWSKELAERSMRDIEGVIPPVVPSTQRTAQMMINKYYGVSTTKGINNRDVIGATRSIEERGFAPHQASNPGNYKSSWDWSISPSDLKKAAGEPRIEYPLDYHQKNQMGGPISYTGYRNDSPDRFNPFNIIPSNNISMHQVDHPVLGVSNTGHSKMMQPGASYKFPGTSVTEYPLLAGKMAVNKGMMRKGGGKWTGPRPWNVKVDRNDSGGLKYGGSSDDCFPDEISFPQQKKNDFLKFLRDTSFDKVQQELNSDITDFHNKTMDEFKKGGWIQKAVKGMRKDKPCTGAKFGSSSCPAGSKRYNLAKTFKKMGKNRQDGGEAKPTFDNFYSTINPEFNDTTTYNLREAYDNLPFDQFKAWRDNPDMNHLPDTYKYPNHPTFSNESKYYKKGMKAVRWEGDKAIPIDSVYQMGGAPNPMAAQAFQSQQTAYHPWWDYIPNAPGALPDMINAGMEGATSFINNLPGGAQDRLKKWQKKTTTADWWNPLQQGSRGDYTTNYGYFRPDQHTGVQFPGAQGFQQYKEGGEYEADEQEIQKLIDQGYKISYI